MMDDIAKKYDFELAQNKKLMERVDRLIKNTIHEIFLWIFIIFYYIGIWALYIITKNDVLRIISLINIVLSIINVWLMYADFKKLNLLRGAKENLVENIYELTEMVNGANNQDGE